MKVIDLLNKIANGEKLPEIIKVMGGSYYLCEGDQSGSYYFSEKQGFGGVKLKFDTSVMNEEVEIIEENKKDKDEEIEVYINGEKVDVTDIYEPLKQGEYFYKENGKWYVHKLKNVSKIIEEDKKIEKLEYWVEIPYNEEGKYLKKGLQEQAKFNENIYFKINEIIDKLNKEE